MPGSAGVRESDERAMFYSPDAGSVLPETAVTPHRQASSLRYPERSQLTLAVGRQHLVRSLRSAELAVAVEFDRGLLFLLVPVMMALGVFVYLALPAEPSLAASSLGSVALLASAYAARNRNVLAPVLILAAALAGGATLARLETWRADTKVLGGEISTVLTGRVVEANQLASGRVRLTLEVVATERPALRYAPRLVRISASSVPDGLVVGSTVNGIARLFPPSGPLRPGSYDFAFESYHDGIGANGFFFRPPKLVQTVDPGFRLRDFVANLRNDIAAHIEAAVSGKAEGEIVAALIVGTRAGIPEAVNESLRRTGLAHILSISGLHMALVAVAIMGTGRLLFALAPGFASRRAVKKAAAFGALAATTAYLALSGADVAAQRSYIMLAVMLIAIMFDRAALSMRNLAIAAMITLVISPHEVVGPSFQMSFAATAVLVAGFQLWARYRRSRPRRPREDRGLIFRLTAGMIRGLVVVAVTSILAGLATTIYGVWHFQRVSPLSLVANVLVSPVISLAMWTGVLASAAVPFGLDRPLFALMGWFVGIMITISNWLSDRSPIDAVGAISPASVVLLTVALLIGALTTSWLRWLALAPLVLGMVLLSDRYAPEILISEDGRLVAWVQGDKISVNRSRPNNFTMTDWQRAAAATEIRKPLKGDPHTDDGQGRFVCAQGICIARHGAFAIAHVEKTEQVAPLCGSMDLIVSADATTQPCSQGATIVISARDLARRGTAVADMNGNKLRVRYSIPEEYRPWHDHRRYSRAARGIAPFIPRSRKSPADNSAKPQ